MRHRRRLPVGVGQCDVDAQHALRLAGCTGRPQDEQYHDEQRLEHGRSAHDVPHPLSASWTRPPHVHHVIAESGARTGPR